MSHFCPSWGRAGAETPCFIGFSGFSALRHRLGIFFSPAEPQPLARASPAPSRPRAGARTAAGAFVLPTKTSAGSTMDMASACLMAGSIPNPGRPVQERSENVANVEMLPVPMLPMANGAARRPAGDLRAWKPATPMRAGAGNAFLATKNAKGTKVEGWEPVLFPQRESLPVCGKTHCRERHVGILVKKRLDSFLPFRLGANAAQQPAAD